MSLKMHANLFFFSNDWCRRMKRVPILRGEKMLFTTILSSRNKVHWGNQVVLFGEAAFWENLVVIRFLVLLSSLTQKKKKCVVIMWSFNLQTLNDSGMISVFGWLHSHLLVKGYTTGYILCSAPVLTSGLTTDWEPWNVSTTAPHQVPGWNPGVTRMCRYQKNPRPSNSYKILGPGGILQTPHPTHSSYGQYDKAGMRTWVSSPPFLWPFHLPSLLDGLGRLARPWKSWTKAGGRMPQDPIASLQSLLLKKTI